MRTASVPVQLAIALSGLLSVPAFAARLDISIEVPRLNVAEYHRPYVAAWLEDADQKVAAHLAVWYQQRDGGEGQGAKWLPDLRQWWRKSGRTLKLPVDGVTGPTRPAGRHALSFSGLDPRLSGLAAGEYTLVVEAVREAGDRELLRIPFRWSAGAAGSGKAQGDGELGLVTLAVEP